MHRLELINTKRCVDIAAHLLYTCVTHLKLRFLKLKWTSTIPVVLTLVRKMSCSVGE